MNIHKEIIDILENNKITEFTNVQTQTIPIFQRQDIIVQSPTGTGKTLAYLIPILNFIYCKRKSLSASKVHSLIITPTRELAVQVFKISELFTTKNILFIGGTDKDDQINILSSGYDIIIGTPGRLYQILKFNQKRFDKCEFLVLDEADKLLNYGFRSLLEGIVDLLPKQRRTGLFTATYDENVGKLSKISLRDYKFIKVENQLVPEELSIKYIQVTPFQKLKTLVQFLNKKSIVFFSSSAEVDYFHELYSSLINAKIYKIHGKLKNCERLVVYEGFCNDGAALFCTDLAARGIDFKNIEFVIHFDCPVDPSNFIHRSGRTARNGETGTSVLFVMENEIPFIHYLKIKKIEISQFSLESDIEIKTEIDLNNYSRISNIFDEKLKKLAVIAFVSYIRSYKEYHLSYLFNLKELNFDSTIALYFLDKVPQMKELQNTVFKRFKRPVKLSKKLRKRSTLK